MKTTQYWLVKQEPDAYSWDDFCRDKTTLWTGVRNYQARNHLRAMAQNDLVFFYASVGPKEVQGIAKVTKVAFPDPTAESGDWSVVELATERTLPAPVTLAQIKADAALQDIALIRQSRLSVMPLTPAEFKRVLALSEGQA